jgi:hypothetical protein
MWVEEALNEANGGTTPFGPYCVPEAELNVAPVTGFSVRVE